LNKKILPIFFLLILSPVFSQESGSVEFPNNANSTFIISAFDFNITGRTRPDAVIYNGEFKEGEEIQGQANLEKYIRDKTQLLLNQRVLESVWIDYSTGQVREDGKIPVNLVINVVDTWNFAIIPTPRYSSNTGLELILKLRNYNFLGTMNPLTINLGYRYDQNKRSSGFFEQEANVPFRAFGYFWNFKFDNYFDYRPSADEIFYFKNTSGISMELPVKNTTFTFGFDESFILNEENEEQYQKLYGEYQAGFYMSSKPYVSWEIPIGIEIGSYGDLIYTPEINAVFNHEFPRWSLKEHLKGPFLTFKHTLGFNRVDWLGNYRRGFDVAAENSYTYDFYRKSHDKDPLSVDYTVSGKGYFIFTEFFGMSAFLQYRQWFCHDPDYYFPAGDALRGILDNDLHADYMLSLNLDFPFRILKFAPSQWFNRPKLHAAEFDLHLSPIIDLALYHDPSTGTSFDFSNILVTGGFELIIFPAAMRSLYIRFSFGWNFVEQANNPQGSREIFIGIGHHY
jgi:hypothetical protein